MLQDPLHIIGGGLAGSEAAWQAAEAGAMVVLHEMRPVRGTDAHQTDRLAELVCSNSFRSDDWETTTPWACCTPRCGALGSLIMACARRPPDAGRRRAGGRPRGLRRGGDRGGSTRIRAITVERGEVAGRRRPIGAASSSPPAPSPPRRWPQAILAADRRGRSCRSSTPSRRSSTPRPSTWAWPGASRATTRTALAATRPPTSTARWTRRSTRPSSTPCWPAPRPSSRTGSMCPTSTAACRSR